MLEGKFEEVTKNRQQKKDDSNNILTNVSVVNE